MPNDRYRRYKWHKRITDFPFTHAVALSIFISAVAFGISWGTNPIGEHMGLLLLCLAIPASLLCMIGLQWKGQVIHGYGIEQAGHWLAVGAWAVNIWILFTLGGTFTIVTPVIFAIAHGLRAFRLHKEASNIKYVVREAARQETEGVIQSA